MADRDLTAKDPDYVRDIAHLLPAEITAFYISIKGIIPAATNPQNGNLAAASAATAAANSSHSATDTATAATTAAQSAVSANEVTLYLLLGVAGVLTVTFYFIMPAMLTIKGRSQRILYCITFIIWVLGIEVDRLGTIVESDHILGETSTIVGRTVVNLFVAIWSFVLPFVFRSINPGPLSVTTIGFSAPNQITNSAGGMSRFKSRRQITVSGSRNNDRSYTVDNSTNTALTTIETIITDEPAGAEITITSP